MTERLRQLGAITFSADEAARAILNPGGAALKEIESVFGKEYILPDGSLDRKMLGERVFNDPAARQRLESITHPLILRLLRAQMEAVQIDFPPGTVLAVEVPLLFEKNLSSWFERIITVVTSQPVQVSRLCSRQKCSEYEARLRISSQMNLEEKAKRADYVIENNGTLAELYSAVDSLWDRFHLAPA